MPEPEAALDAIQPGSERSRTIDVITRKVAEGKELERSDSVFIRPLPFRRWPQAIGHIAKLLEYLPEEGLNFSSNIDLAVWIATLAGQVSDDLFAVIELATDKKPEFFDTVDPDDGVKIIMAVIEVNKDFFTRNVMPLVNDYLPAITEQAKETLGQTQ